MSSTPTRGPEADYQPLQVVSVSLADVVRRLRAQAGVVIAIAAVTGVLALVVSFLLEKSYEAEVDIEVGAVSGQFIESPRALADFIASEGFRRTLEAELETGLRPGAIVAQVVGGPEPTNTAYVQVLARRASRVEAHATAERVAQLIDARHRDVYAKATESVTSYEKNLETSLAQLGQDIASIQDKLGTVAGAAGGVTAMLLQSNLADSRTRQLELQKQLKDSMVARTLGTKPTRVAGPPTDDPRPVWPKPVLFTAIGIVLGAALGAVVAAARG